MMEIPYIEYEVPLKFYDAFWEDDYTRYLVPYGGRGSSKSESAAQLCIDRSYKYEDCKIVCGREVQKSIQDSSKSLIEKHIRQKRIEKNFHITKTRITNLLTGVEFLFLGLSDTTKDNIASIDNVKLLWIEEAHKITESTWMRVYPSIRAKGSQILITFNPHSPEDIIYKTFVTEGRRNAKVVKINYEDNPWFKESSLYEEMQIDLETKPKAYFEHVWLGELKDYNEDPVIFTEKWGRYDNSKKYRYSKIVISMDTAYSVKESADYSVIGIFGEYLNKEVHVLKIMRGRWLYDELHTQLKFAVNSLNDYEYDQYKIIIEDKASGQSLIPDLRAKTSLNIEAFKPLKDKYSRVCEVTSLLNTSDFKLPYFTDNHFWVKEYIRECNLFTGAMTHENDDQVDVTSMALNDIICNKTFNAKDWLNVKY